MVGFDPLGWLGGVWSGGWIPGFTPSTPTQPEPKIITTPQISSTQPPQQPVNPMLGSTQTNVTDDQFIQKNINTPNLDPFGRELQDHSATEYQNYQNAMRQQEAQRQQTIQQQELQRPQGIISYDKTNIFRGYKYPAIEIRNPVQVGKEAVKDVEMSFDKLFGYTAKGGYLSNTPNPIGAYKDLSTAVGRGTTLNLPDLETNEPVKKFINDNSLKGLLGVSYYIPPVKQFVDSKTGKDISTTIGTAGRTIYSDIRSDPLSALGYLYGPRMFKGAQYGIEGLIAKGAVSSSPLWRTTAKVLSTPTAASLSKLTQAGVIGYTGLSAYGSYKEAPNTPEGKGEAIGHIATPIVLMTAGLPLAARYNPPIINNPYAGRGYFSGELEKSIFGKAKDRAYNTIFGQKTSIQKGIGIQNTARWDITSTKKPIKIGEMQKAPKKVIEETIIPSDRWNVYGDYQQSKKISKPIGNIQAYKTYIPKELPMKAPEPSRFLGINDISTKTYRIPGTNKYITRGQAIKAGYITAAVVGGTTLGYLYGDKIRNNVKNIQNSKYAPLLSGGLVIGGTTLGLKTKLLQPLKTELNYYDKSAKFDKNIYKWDNYLGMWRLLTENEMSAWELKQSPKLKIELLKQEIKPINKIEPIWKYPESKVTTTKKSLNLNLLFGQDTKKQQLKEQNLNKQQIKSTLLNLKTLAEQKQDRKTEYKNTIKETPGGSVTSPPIITPRIYKYTGKGAIGIILPSYTSAEPKIKQQKKKKSAHWETGAAPTSPSVASFVFGTQKTKYKQRVPAKINHNNSEIDDLFSVPKQRKPAQFKTNGKVKLMKTQNISSEVKKGMSSGLITYAKVKK